MKKHISHTIREKHSRMLQNNLNVFKTLPLMFLFFLVFVGVESLRSEGSVSAGTLACFVHYFWYVYSYIFFRICGFSVVHVCYLSLCHPPSLL